MSYFNHPVKVLVFQAAIVGLVERLLRMAGVVETVDIQVVFTGTVACASWGLGGKGITGTIKLPALAEKSVIDRAKANRWVGYVIHEVWHVVFTHRGEWDQFCWAHPQPLAKHLLNAVEDARIERAGMALGYADGFKVVGKDLLDHMMVTGGMDCNPNDPRQIPWVFAVGLRNYGVRGERRLFSALDPRIAAILEGARQQFAALPITQELSDGKVVRYSNTLGTMEAGAIALWILDELKKLNADQPKQPKQPKGPDGDFPIPIPTNPQPEGGEKGEEGYPGEGEQGHDANDDDPDDVDESERDAGNAEGQDYDDDAGKHSGDDDRDPAHDNSEEDADDVTGGEQGEGPSDGDGDDDDGEAGEAQAGNGGADAKEGDAKEGDDGEAGAGKGGGKPLDPKDFDNLDNLDNSEIHCPEPTVQNEEGESSTPKGKQSRPTVVRSPGVYPILPSSPEAGTRSTREWQRVLRTIRASALRLSLRRLMQRSDFAGRESGLRSGRLSARGVNRLLNGSENVFDRRFEVEGENVAVSLLIDRSGSMKGASMVNAATVALLIGETAANAGARLEVVAFDSDSSDDNVLTETLFKEAGRNGFLFASASAVYVCKAFNQTIGHLRRMYSTMTRMANGGTSDASALQWTGDRLVAQAANRKILFVICDGCGDNTPVFRSVVDKLEAKGVIVIGIGIGCWAELFLPRFQYATVINGASELCSKAFGMLVATIAKARGL